MTSEKIMLGKQEWTINCFVSENSKIGIESYDEAEKRAERTVKFTKVFGLVKKVVES